MVAALAFAVPGYGALVAPTGTTTSVGEPVPAFAWNAVTGADHYTFELDSGASLGTPLVTITTKNTRATLTQTIADGPYTWRVRAVSATGTNGYWSNAVNWTKTGTGPTLIAPAPSATITYPSPVLLQWTPVDGAFNYIVSIADSSNMANAAAVTTEATSYSPGSWLPPGVHYWTVTAKDARGNPVGTASQDVVRIDRHFAAAARGVDDVLRDGVARGVTTQAFHNLQALPHAGAQVG